MKLFWTILKVTGATALIPTSPTLDQARLKEAVDADRFWDKHLGTNDTVIARTFQVRFKNYLFLYFLTDRFDVFFFRDNLKVL